MVSFTFKVKETRGKQEIVDVVLPPTYQRLAMGPHILMRGLPTSPNEPLGICSHLRGRGLRPLPQESDAQGAHPGSSYIMDTSDAIFRMS